MHETAGNRELWLKLIICVVELSVCADVGQCFLKPQEHGQGRKVCCRSNWLWIDFCRLDMLPKTGLLMMSSKIYYLAIWQIMRSSGIFSTHDGENDNKPRTQKKKFANLVLNSIDESFVSKAKLELVLFIDNSFLQKKVFSSKKSYFSK